MVLRLKKLLLTLKAGEQQVEFARQMLAQLPEFEPHAAFQRFDSDGDGAISSVDILKFLRANKVDEANEADCYGIVRYYSTTSLGVLHFNDFLQILMPIDNPNLRSDVAMRPNFSVPAGEQLGGRVETALTQLFEKEIAFNRLMEEQK